MSITYSAISEPAGEFFKSRVWTGAVPSARTMPVGCGALRAGALEQLHQLGRAEILEPYRTRRLTKAGATLEVWIIATALVNEAGQIYAIATTERVAAGEDTL